MPWTEITRREYGRNKLRYASDLTDEEWALILSYLPEPGRFGRPRTTDLRGVVEGTAVYADDRLPMADAAEMLSALFDGAVPLLPMARRRFMGSDQP